MTRKPSGMVICQAGDTIGDGMLGSQVEPDNVVPPGFYYAVFTGGAGVTLEVITECSGSFGITPTTAEILPLYIDRCLIVVSAGAVLFVRVPTTIEGGLQDHQYRTIKGSEIDAINTLNSGVVRSNAAILTTTTGR